MPNNRRLTKKTIKGKDSVHPGSRKAGQLNRVHLRASKLQNHAKLRKDASSYKLQRPLFFHHAISSPSPLTLSSLKALIEVYIARNDTRIEELTAERRPGRPKEKELLELEDLRKREAKEFETGFELPDLTHAPTTRLLHTFHAQSINLDAPRLDLLRHIRVIRDSEDVVVSRKGRTEGMGLGTGTGGSGEDWTEGAEGAELGEEKGEMVVETA
ncbi:hypothetical protein EHS25_002380 [Saitozyma podzolica]|uniref:Translation machinery-associated protein 16 n=1 Tax=Saitozyma podzolica TaxID=1890683 RepID=A0A427YDW2_9TREE|nr:hypothetical protein EHS25_002380 [Saitozyma podzolica]